MYRYTEHNGVAEHSFDGVGMRVRLPSSSARDREEAPRRGTKHRDLDEAIAQLEAEKDFPPTTFHVAWPNEVSDGRPVRNPVWDTVESQSRTVPSEEFPTRLRSHIPGKPLPVGERVYYQRTVTPGPGAYNGIVTRAEVSLTRTQVPLALRRPRRSNSMGVALGPGPSTYNPRNLSSSQSVTFGSSFDRFSHMVADNSLGPGDYNPTHARPQSAPHAFSKSSRFRKSTKRSPGPAAYQPKVQSQPPTPHLSLTKN